VCRASQEFPLVKRDVLETLPPLSPSLFFSVGAEARYLPDMQRGFPDRIFKELDPSFLLPNTSSLLFEDSFAQMSLAWHESGILLQAQVHAALEMSFFPHFRDGDSLELFLDTRRMNMAKSATRFCHHIMILAQKVGQIQCREITKHRVDDQRPLMKEEDFLFSVNWNDKTYQYILFLPQASLYGYDPASFKQVGFTYRVNRFGGKAQHFACSQEDLSVEKHPLFWGCLQLS